MLVMTKIDTGQDVAINARHIVCIEPRGDDRCIVVLPGKKNFLVNENVEAVCARFSAGS